MVGGWLGGSSTRPPCLGALVRLVWFFTTEWSQDRRMPSPNEYASAVLAPPSVLASPSDSFCQIKYHTHILYILHTYFTAGGALNLNRPCPVSLDVQNLCTGYRPPPRLSSAAARMAWLEIMITDSPSGTRSAHRMKAPLNSPATPSCCAMCRPVTQ